MNEVHDIDVEVEETRVGAANGVGQAIDYARLFMSRHYLVIVVIALLGIVAGFGYLRVASSTYTAATTIDIRSREGGFLQQQASVTDAPFDVQREIALLTSPVVALVVLGIAGAFVGGLIAQVIRGDALFILQPAGFIGAVIGSVVLLMLGRALSPKGR